MHSEVITDLDQITSSWLTAALTKSGALTHGRVESLTMDATPRELSTSARLSLRYTADARGDLPQRLFMKLVNIDREDEFFGPSEVNYYTRDYLGVTDAPIPRCYDAAFSAGQQRYHILMDDLSQTHVEAYTKTPTLAYGLALAEALASLHAHWWGAERLAAGGEPIPSAQAIQRFVEVARPGADHILAACADDLAPHWPQAIRELLDWHPQAMIERTRSGAGFTLIHGDVNGGNVFVPIDGVRPLFIVDRQPFDWSLTTWLGVYDLSYAIVHRWDPALRRQWEQPILCHYLACLHARGVNDYAWDQFYADYRLCAAMSVYVAIEWCRGGLNEATRPYWLPMLQKAMTAFDDLECIALRIR
jgi:hypothetical protein